MEKTPEEQVRQELICKMVSALRFPKSLMVVEKELEQLPHLTKRALPLAKRRVDLLCFGRGIHPQYPLYPLLMVECKAEASLQEAIEQIMGYNYYVGAYFLAVANREEIKTFWYDEKKKDYQFIPRLLSYPQMIKGVIHAKTQ